MESFQGREAKRQWPKVHIGIYVKEACAVKSLTDARAKQESI